MCYFCLVFHRYKLDAKGQVVVLTVLKRIMFWKGNNTHREVAFHGFHSLFLFFQEHIKHVLFEFFSNFGPDKLCPAVKKILKSIGGIKISN